MGTKASKKHKRSAAHRDGPIVSLKLGYASPVYCYWRDDRGRWMVLASATRVARVTAHVLKRRLDKLELAMIASGWDGGFDAP